MHTAEHRERLESSQKELKNLFMSVYDSSEEQAEELAKLACKRGDTVFSRAFTEAVTSISTICNNCWKPIPEKKILKFRTLAYCSQECFDKDLKEKTKIV